MGGTLSVTFLSKKQHFKGKICPMSQHHEKTHPAKYITAKFYNVWCALFNFCQTLLMGGTLSVTYTCYNIIAEMIKPCIVGDKWLCFFIFLSLISQILYWQNFARQFAKISYLRNLVTYMTCSLALTTMNIFMLSWTFHFFEIQDLIIPATIMLHHKLTVVS